MTEGSSPSVLFDFQCFKNFYYKKCTIYLVMSFLDITFDTETESNNIMSRKNQLTTADHLSYSEYEKLLKCLHDDKEYIWEMYARLSFCTACRASDVLKFRWLDVIDKTETTVQERKTGKARIIKFNASVRQKLRSLWELLGCPNRALYIFENKHTGKPMTIQNINQQLKLMKCRYRINVGNFSTHTFRKTFGRYVYDKHGHSAESLILLNKILNHSNIQVTKAYIGITQDEINNIYDSIRF